MDSNKYLDDCKSGWLMVEADFTARLFKSEQLKYALQCMGRNPSDKVIGRYWSQCGGSMSYDQFCLVMKRERKTTMSDLMASFRKIDINGDGYITAQELHKVLTKRGEKMSRDEVQAIIDEADENGDGKLDYAEFAHMLLNTSENCVQAAKQNAEQTSQTGSIRQTGSSNKRKGTSKNHSRKSSFDRQRQREDIRSQLFPRGSPHRSGYGYLANRHPENERGLFASEPRFDSHPRHSQATGERTSELPQLNSLSAVQSSPPNVQSTVDLPIEPTASQSSSNEPNPSTSLVSESTAVNSVHIQQRILEESESVPSQDQLELKASSLTKLPPLKKTTLPPLIPPIAVTSKTEQDTSAPSQSEPLSSTTDKPSVPLTKVEDETPCEAGDTNKSPASLVSVQSEDDENKDTTVVPPNEPLIETKHDTGNVDEKSSEQTTPPQTLDKPVEDSSRKVSESDSNLRETIDGSQESDRQTDHLDKPETSESQEDEVEEKRKPDTAPPTSVVTPPPKKPINIQAWNSITGKGCFYLDLDDVSTDTQDEDGVIRCHHYRLKLPSPTNVWIEVGVAKPGIPATDVLLFVFHTDENEEPTELITYTQHRVGEHWVGKLDLDAGTYALVPFTSRCYLKPREDEKEEGVALLTEEGGHVSLSEECCGALEEVFHRMDLDGNGFISRTEFDFFQERTSGEICDDEAWKVIQDNFELTPDDELTLKGFLDLHVMTAEDEEGGEAEVREILDSLGYDNQLQLDQACPFLFDVYTEDNEGEIEIVDLLPFSPLTDPAHSCLIKERGVAEPVKDGKGELDMYTFTTPHMTTIVLENKSSKNASVQLDCSKSTNCVFSRDSALHVVSVLANSTVVGFHIQPLDLSEPHVVDCFASKILC